MKTYKKYFAKSLDYFKKHPMYNATVHIIGGMAIGIVITYPFIGSHPLRWGIGLAAVAILGHLYTLWKK